MVAVNISRLHAGQNFMRPIILALALLCLVGATLGVYFVPSSDDTVRQLLVQESVAAYLATGGVCPCPYSLNRNGLQCVHQSEYERRGRAGSLCYPDDVTASMVQAWRYSHR